MPHCCKIMKNRLIFLLTCFIGLTIAGDRDIGKKCIADYECQKSSAFQFVFVFDEEIICIDGYCKCKPAVEIQYGNFMEPSCNSFQHRLKLLPGRCNETSCKANEECVPMQEKGDTVWLYTKLCYCKEGFLRVDGNCEEVTYVGALDGCGRSGGKAKACNLEGHSKCSSGRCVCFDDYFANLTSKKCEPMANYLKAYNLREYRVRPNEYCSKDSECISGLECRSARCACPRPCTYNSTLEICDCGTDAHLKPNVPPGPFIVGILLGIFIMGFWYAMIVRTVRKMRAKRRDNFSHLSGARQDSSTMNTYTLDPVSAASGSNNPSSAPVGLSVPISSRSGRQSPSPSPKSPSKFGVDMPSSSPPHPSPASLYGLNPPQAHGPYSYPTAPPAYSEIDMTSDPSPPPYSLDPPTPNAATAPPYPTDLANLPYPVNPSDLRSAPPKE